MKKLTRFAVSALIFLAVGCAHRGGLVGFSTVQPPAAKPSIASDLARLNAPVASVNDSNRELAAKVAVLKREAAAARSDAGEAVGRAKQLAAAGAATKAQLDQAWRDITKVHDRNLFLEAETTNLGTVVDRQAAELVRVNTSLQAAATAAAAKDAEADQLRAGLTAANQTIEKLGKAAGDEQARADTAEKRLAGAMVYKRWVLTIIAIFVLYWILRLLKVTPFGQAWLFWLP